MLFIPSRNIGTILLGVIVSFGVAACKSNAPDTGDEAGAGLNGSVTVAAGGREGIQGDANAGGGQSNSVGRGGAGTRGASGATASAGRGDLGSARAGTGGQARAGVDAGSGGEDDVPVDTGPLFPPNNGKDLCPDPSLRMRFSGPPTVGSSGKIRVFKTSAPGTPVAVVDLAVMTVSETIGGTAFNLPRPVYINGNEVIVRLPPRSLGYGQSYYVTVDAGAIKGPDGTSMTMTGSTDWQFSTLAAAPSNLSALRVAVDGTGQFCSVQGALDALPAKNSAASTITIRKGTYFEVVLLASKNNITLHGQDRKATIILGVNNNNLNSSTATRSLVGIDRSSGIVVENLTIHNLTPQGGSQAEALRMESCDQCVVRHANIISLQDTLLWSGRIYANDCTIEGNTDFVWGMGTAFLDHCEIKTVERSGAIVVARNDASGYGYVFVDSKLTADPGITGHVLGRVDATLHPGSHVAYINCQMGSHIAPAGWTVFGVAIGGSVRFWEYQSTDFSGAPIDVSRRIAGSTQISADEAARMRDPAQVLGGWTPPK